jgi:hypothetical protein
MKKKNLKKALLPHDKLTVVRNLSKQTKAEEEKKEQTRNNPIKNGLCLMNGMDI